MTWLDGYGPGVRAALRALPLLGVVLVGCGLLLVFYNGVWWGSISLVAGVGAVGYWFYVRVDGRREVERRHREEARWRALGLDGPDDPGPPRRI